MKTHLYQAICFFLIQIPAGYAIERFIQNFVDYSHNAFVLAFFLINLSYISYTVFCYVYLYRLTDLTDNKNYIWAVKLYLICFYIVSIFCMNFLTQLSLRYQTSADELLFRGFKIWNIL